MTTKEQERKALEQIKKILAGLEEDSYVATAMRGMVNDAEINIENDWALSRYDAWQEAEHKADKAEAELLEANVKVAYLKTQISNLTETITDLNRKLAEARKQAREAEANMIDEIKEVHIQTTDGEDELKRFAEIEYFNDNGFRFINVKEKSGWTNSYKITDLKKLIIR